MNLTLPEQVNCKKTRTNELLVYVEVQVQKYMSSSIALSSKTPQKLKLKSF